MPERSIYVYTTGVLNIPMSDRKSRYLFFEIDSWNRKDFNTVLSVYKKYGLCVYWHTTTNGYHFFSLRQLSKEQHAKIMKELKPLNPDWPPTTLRIKANKWEGERELWKNGGIERNEFAIELTEIQRPNLEEHGYVDYSELTELSKFRDWIEHGFMGLIQTHYNVVKYPLEECPKCKKSINIYCRKTDNKFICKTCRIECKPRGNNGA